MKLKEMLGRLTGIKGQDIVHHGEAIMPSPLDLPRYEQELWDNAAIAVIPALIINPSEWSGDNEAGGGDEKLYRRGKGCFLYGRRIHGRAIKATEGQ